MNLRFSARSIKQNTEDYVSLADYQLESFQEWTEGDGSPQKPYRVHVRICNSNKESWKGVLHIELPVKKQSPAFFLPGFMYGTNRGDCPQNVSCEYPRMREGGLQRPSSSWWMVRGDRLSTPVAMIFDQGRVTGISGKPYWMKECGAGETLFRQYAGYTCSMNCGDDSGSSSVGYTLGYENAPWLFIQSHTVEERAPLGDNCFELESGETVEFDLMVFDYPAEEATGIHEAVRKIYEEYHEPPRKVSSVKQAVAELSEAIFSRAWLEEQKMYSGFVWKREKGKYDYNPLGSLSWTNGLSVAVPMLMAGIRLNREDIRKQALICMENILSHCMNPRSGLPYDAVADGKWSVRGWWFDGMHTPGHCAYLTGQAVYYVMKAYQYEKEKMHCEHEEWVSFAKAILAKVEGEKNSEQEYPFIFSEQTGAGLEYDAFGGVWCLAAAACYSWVTGDDTYLAGLQESEMHYYERYVKRVICYGAPLDTDKAVDSEGILAYMRGVSYLHRITGDDKYLAHLRDALEYEFTFKFCYNSPVKWPPLSRIGWSSCGGSITSTANPHIHPMSSTVVDEMLYYVEKTEDAYVKSRLRDTVLWGCQTYNTYDGEYDYGEKGWMSERFCYSQGLLCEKYPDGSLASTWFALMPWASGSIIEGLAGELWEVLSRNEDYV